MQHLLEIDSEDASLPEDTRRCEDTCVDGVNWQFLLDAARGHYDVSGVAFDYSEVSGGEPEQDFVDRLVGEVRRATSSGLLARVTSAMSQSGLAALERACLCKVVVSG